MIDVAIGLALTFLMFAGLVSGIQELFAATLDRRGQLLKKGIFRLLGGRGKTDAEATLLLKNIYDHPVVSALRKNGTGNPTYMPAASFAIALVDVVNRRYLAARPLFEGLPEAIPRLPHGELRQILEVLSAQSGGNAARLQSLIESHFNAAMNSVSGMYKRWTQLWLLVIGLFLAGILNVDAISIAKHLTMDAALRANLVSQAEIIVKNSSEPALKKSADDLGRRLDEFRSSGLPIGWPTNDSGMLMIHLPSWLQLAGWLLTTIAGALGSPFWFDALSKLVSLRSTGARPSTQTTGPTADIARADAAGQQGAPLPAASPAEAGSANDFEASMLTPADIEGLQLALGVPTGQINGVLDGATRERIRDWQTANGIAATGLLDHGAVLDILYGKTQGESS